MTWTQADHACRLRHDFANQHLVNLWRKKGPRDAAPAGKIGDSRGLETVKDLVGPETLEAGQSLIEAVELLRREAGDIGDRQDLPIVERIDFLADLLPSRRQPDTHRTLVGIGALMIDIARFDQLLQVVGDIGTLI